jgi:hypothetical protein
MICYCGWSGACPTQIVDVVDWDPKVDWREGSTEVGMNLIGLSLKDCVLNWA